jgi:hypothetical protein
LIGYGAAITLPCSRFKRNFPLIAIFFGVISLLYATVGQAGGTAFLALMAFANFPPSSHGTRA